MALEDYGPYNPTGYDPKKPRPMPPPADVPRGGMPVPGPLGQAPVIPDEPRETYADPHSPTRGMRYGLGDQRDLSVPVIDPRSPSAPPPARWGRARYISPDSVKVPEITDWDRRLAGANAGNIRREYDWGGSRYIYAANDDLLGEYIPEEYIRRDKDGSWVDLDIAKNRVAEYDAAMARRAALGPEGVRIARDSNGGYAYAHGRPVADQSTPRPLFSGAAGEDFEATRRRGEQVARLMRETDGPFANPNDWNYVRSYGPRAAAQAVASGRANISGAPPELVAQERERFLRNRTTDLSISPQLRSAARDELAQIERDAAEERRREMWAEEQAGLTDRARIAASVPVVGPGGVAAIPNAAGSWDVSRPEPAPAAPPAPVSFGGGAGAIPEIGADGQPTGRYVYQAPPQDQNAGRKPIAMDAETPGMFDEKGAWVDNPAYSPKPVPIGGNAVGTWNKETKSYDVVFPPKQGEKGARAVTLKPGESYYDPETKETYVAPGMDYVSIQAEIAGWQKAYTDAKNPTDKKKIEDKIADAQRRLAALGAPPEQPAPAPTATAQPAPAATEQPAQSAEQPAAPPRRRRFEG